MVSGSQGLKVKPRKLPVKSKVIIGKVWGAVGAAVIGATIYGIAPKLAEQGTKSDASANRVYDYRLKKGLPSYRSKGLPGAKVDTQDCVKDPTSPFCNAKKGCVVNEGTKQVIAEGDMYWDKFSQLQQGFNGEDAACSATQVAKDIRKVFGIVGRMAELCRADHQNELRNLENNKGLYYARLVLLQKEPLCSNLVSRVSGRAMPATATPGPVAVKEISESTSYAAGVVK